MLFLIGLTSSKVLTLTPDNFSVVGGDHPYLIKYWRPGCGFCERMAEDFEEASNMFDNVYFGAVDCMANKKICQSKNIDGYPTVILYGAHNTTGALYEDSLRTADSFADFIETTIHIKGNRPPKIVKELTTVNFNHTLDSTKYTLVTYYVPFNAHCKEWLPVNKRIATAFIADNDTIQFATVNCEKYKSICKDVQSFPKIKLIKKDAAEVNEYSGDLTPEIALDFINKNCGTERGLDGLLNDKAGLIDEVDEVVKEFLQSEDKQEAINKAKILQADLYVTFMERILKNGVEKSKEDLKKIADLLKARKSSYKVLDNLKRRYNVFATVLGERENTKQQIVQSNTAEEKKDL